MTGLALGTRRARVAGYTILGLLAYVPILLTARGDVAADTKQYLYLEPGRLVSRTVSMWDPFIGLGTVTHQTIGYLFPMGPYYWVMEALGSPDWVAQRVWLGSILFAAGTGVLFLARTLDLRGPGAVVAALMFMLSPYSLHYSARISVILLPWAALPWMVALVARGLRRGGWRHAAIFAVIVQFVGSVNATALVFAGIAPVLFVLFAVWVTREVTWRQALATVIRFGVLTLAASLWWMSGLWAQGNYGINILRYTETVETVALTSLAPEALRGLGYWFFYGRDKLGAWIEANLDYTQSPGQILVSYSVPIMALLAASFVRWRYRVYFVLLVLVGTAVAVGAHPYDDPSPFGALLKSFADSSQAGLALRSTGRAVPLIVLGLAGLLGAGVNAGWSWLQDRQLRAVSFVAVGAVAAILIVNLPALWNGHFYGENLTRPEEIPEYWLEAASYLNAQGHHTRVLELPGSDFASYEWGNTVDPITPGLIDRPYVARELIPYGSAASADFLNAFDRRLQEGVLDRDSVEHVARLMGVGDVVLRNDLQNERFNTPRPTLLWPQFSPVPPPGLELAATFGTEIPEAPTIFPLLDEQALALPPDTPSGPPVAVFGVEDPTAVVRVQPLEGPLLLAGDGEGLVDAAAVGLVNDEAVVLYSASYSADPDALRREIDRDATLVVTDTNRKRGRRWGTVRDNVGYTERADEEPWGDDPNDNRLPLFPDAGTDTQTVVEQRGAVVEATAYGNPISYTPEDRAARAVDGDLETAWKVGAFSEVIGEKIRVETPEPVTTDRVNLIQVLRGPKERYITRATLRFDGGDPVTVDLAEVSRTPEGQTIAFGERTFRDLEIEIDDTNRGRLIEYIGVSAVGFAEIRYRDQASDRDVQVEEIVRLPTDLLAVAGESSLERPLTLVMTRLRVPPVPPRYDEELQLARTFELPTPRSFGFTGVARVSPDAPETVLDTLFGVVPVEDGGVTATSTSSLPGDPTARAASAIDGDPTTAWTAAFEPSVQGLRIRTSDVVTLDRLDLAVVADGRHSVPTAVRITNRAGEERSAELPVVEDADRPGAVAEAPVSFAPITGDDFTVTFTGVRHILTTDYFSVSPVALPIAIVELGAPGVELVTEGNDAIDTGCRDDLLTIDGEPFPIRVTGEHDVAATRGELDVAACGDLALDAGVHTLRAQPGRTTGIDLDRVVMPSDAGGAPGAIEPLATVPSPPVEGGRPALEVTDLGRTAVHAEVHDAEVPFWFVLGESYNDGWTLEVNGRDLGQGELVNGYANGWQVDPQGSEELRITARWTPQTVVVAALAASGAVFAACLVIIFVTRRGATIPLADAPLPVLGPPWNGRAASGGILVAGAVVPALVAAALIRPWTGVLVGAAAVAILLWPRLRFVFALVPAGLLALCAMFIALQQYRVEYPPFFEWPTFFDRVHVVGWLAVVFLATGAWIEVLRRWRGPDT